MTVLDDHLRVRARLAKQLRTELTSMRERHEVELKAEQWEDPERWEARRYECNLEWRKLLRDQRWLHNLRGEGEIAVFSNLAQLPSLDYSRAWATYLAGKGEWPHGEPKDARKQRRNAECLALTGAVGVAVRVPVDPKYFPRKGKPTQRDRVMVLLPNNDLVEPKCAEHHARVCERLVPGVLDVEATQDLAALYETYMERLVEYRQDALESTTKKYKVREKPESL